MSEATVTVQFPIDQNEQARQLKAEHLLPQDVYLKVAMLIEANLAKLNNMKSAGALLEDIDECRAHETILIDGGRGAGKSSVLVNLEMFLRDATCNKTGLKAEDLLILKPVDPTLVENGDSLLLNIIVAALMRNNEVRKKLDKSDYRADDFYEQLQKLGTALEAVETQKDKHGIDKLRSFMGGHGLAQEIHKLFKMTLELTGKELIILPIDDVDTSLHHAFENIEIVRKYLSSPYIIPIVSGDLDLYGEIIWRNFHGRIVKDSSLHRMQAKVKAIELKEEYQRKIMPLNRRIDMPDYDYYTQRDNIIIIDSSANSISSLKELFHWIKVVLNGTINGKENSKLSLPFESIREISQFVTYFKEEIIDFGKSLSKNKNNVNYENNKWLFFAQKLVEEKLAAKFLINDTELYRSFHQQYDRDTELSNSTNQKISKEAYEKKFNEFKENKINELEEIKKQQLKGGSLLKNKEKWLCKLKEYFIHEPKGGAIYLMAKANDDWYHQSLVGRVFGTELFLPLAQGGKLFNIFDKNNVIRDAWQENLHKRLPNSSWFSNIIEKSILPYPLPEQGCQVASLKDQIRGMSGKPDPETLRKKTSKRVKLGFLDFVSEEQIAQLEFIRLLMCHKNFYTTAKITNLLYCGRVLELVVLSLTREITETDITDILYGQPFYSLASLAPTKPIDLSNDDVEHGDADEVFASKNNSYIQTLVEEINSWREKYKSPMVEPWLVYNVFNKYFNQVNLFNTADNLSSLRSPMNTLLDKANQSFNCLWATFGSFEKGPTFGLDELIAYSNTSATRNFDSTDLFNFNIRDFFNKRKRSISNTSKGSVTYMLGEHPLRLLLNDVNALVAEDLYDVAKKVLKGESINRLCYMSLGGIKYLYNSITELSGENQIAKDQMQVINSSLEIKKASEFNNLTPAIPFKSSSNLFVINEWKSKNSLEDKVKLVFFRYQVDE